MSYYQWQRHHEGIHGSSFSCNLHWRSDIKTGPDTEPKPKLLLSHHSSRENYREDTAVAFLSLSTLRTVSDEHKFSDRDDEIRSAPL